MFALSKDARERGRGGVREQTNYPPLVHLHSAFRGGLTLIELIVVMTLLVLLAFISLPSFVTATKSAQVRTATQQLVAVLRYARAKALSIGRPILVELDREGNTVRVLLPADVVQRQTEQRTRSWEAETSEWTGEDWWKLAGERLETLDPLDFVQDPSPMGKERKLPEGTKVVSVTDSVSGEELNLISFYPDGTASGVLITLQGERTGAVLEVAPMMGSVSVEEIVPSGIR